MIKYYLTSGPFNTLHLFVLRLKIALFQENFTPSSSIKLFSFLSTIFLFAFQSIFLGRLHRYFAILSEMLCLEETTQLIFLKKCPILTTHGQLTQYNNQHNTTTSSSRYDQTKNKPHLSSQDEDYHYLMRPSRFPRHQMPRWKSWSPSSTRWQRRPSSSRVMTRNRTSCSTGQSSRANKTQLLLPSPGSTELLFLTYAAFSFFEQLSTVKECFIFLAVWYSKTRKYWKNIELSCHTFYCFTVSTIFSSLSQFSRRVMLSWCN